MRDALRLPTLRRGRPEVVAGAAGLDRRIRWAHSGEVTNIAELLAGGELLLTTGMGLGRTPAQQRRFVAELARRDVAGMVLELGLTHTRPPGALVAAAEAKGIPFVVLHREVPFVAITEEIHKAIIGHQLAILRRGEEIHRRFTALLLEGAGAPQVLEALATAVANPALLERGGSVVLHATYRAGDAEVLAAAHTPDPGALNLAIPSARGTTWGSLIVLGLDSPLTDDSLIAAERAVGVLAVVLLRELEDELLVFGEHGRFLTDLATGDVDADDAQARADGLRFDHDAAWLLPMALAPAHGTWATTTTWTAVCRTLMADLSDRRIPTLVGAEGKIPDGAAALLIAGLTTPERRGDTADQVARAVRDAAERHLGTPAGAVLAAGPAIPGWAGAGEALREAAGAAALARDDPPRPWHDAAVPELRHLLWRLRDDWRVSAFAARRLAPVVDHDTARPAAPLLATLEALCDHGWSKADAARALHLERQSIYPRLKRLQEVLGVGLDDPDTQAALHLAVLARRLSAISRTSRART